MPSRLHIDLSVQDYTSLLKMRDHGAPAYLRERAAAVLKVAAGESCNHVAHHGLLRPHKARTVTTWCHRFLNEGIDGLHMRPGRGRKPGFSPSVRVER